MLYCKAVWLADARAPVRSMKARRMLTTINTPKRQFFECAFTLPTRKTNSNKIRSSTQTRKRKTAKAQNAGTISAQMTLPIAGTAERESTSAEQIKPTPIRSSPRVRRRVNKDIQRPFPGL